MHEYQLTEMVSALVSSGLVAPENQELATKCLQGCWSNKIADIWSIEDVKSLRPDFTDEQCWDVLETALHSFDASVGINWDTLQSLIDTYYDEDAIA